MTATYILAPYVRLALHGTTLYLGFGSIQQRIVDTAIHELVVSIVDYWLTPKSIDEVIDEFVRVRGYRRPRVEDVVHLLVDGHFLFPNLTHGDVMRYHRSLLYYGLSGADPLEVQRRLQHAHVVILGCGGIGNLIAASLTTAGVERLTLIDQDVIELSNLTRQICFTEADVGTPKASVLAAALLARNSNVQVQSIPVHLRTEADMCHLPDSDLVVLSADTPDAIAQWTNAWCIARLTPFINVGYVEDIAVWGPFVIPGQTGCFECHDLFLHTQAAPSDLIQRIHVINQRYQAPSTGPINLLSASYALFDIIHYLGGFAPIHSLNKRIGLRTQTLQMEVQECPKNPSCHRCSHLGDSKTHGEEDQQNNHV